MRVKIKDGKVVCEMKDPIEQKHEFLSACYFCLDGFDGHGNLKLWEYDDVKMTPLGMAHESIWPLEDLINNAEKFGVPVDDEVRELLNQRKEEEEEIIRQYKLKDEEFNKREKWRSLCKHGCGLCKNKKRRVFGDDVNWICTATGQYCEEKNEPYYDGNVWRLFNLSAYPNEQCPYKAEPIDETDEEYIAYRNRQIKKLY